MRNATLSKSIDDLWYLLSQVNHKVMILRQKELTKYDIPVRQTIVLFAIQTLGPKASLTNVAERVERSLHSVSRQVLRMENDGLIKRSKIKPKSNQLTLELTEKGLEKLKVARKAKSVSAILSFLAEEDRQQMISILKEILVKLDEYIPK